MLNRFSLRGVILLSGVALGFSMLGAARVSAQPWQDGGGQQNNAPPVYQQHPVDGRPFDGHRRDDRRDRRDFRRDSRFASPQISAGSFQRPYPYHLDYYKMRYGGSYAPYYGNLYGTPFGTPQVVNYPPYYGPYYTGNGGYGNDYGQPGYGGAPAEYPANPGMMAPGADIEEPAASQTQTGGPQAKSGSEALPAPTR